MSTISVISLANRLADARALWSAHWDEQGEAAARMLPFNPDVEAFLELEKRGWFAYIGVLEGDELIGHFGLMFHKNRQTSLMTAGDDFLYIKPEHRKGLLAVKMIKFARDLAYEKGAVEFSISFRTYGSVDLAPLLKRCGMQHIANVYSARR